jgi:hypothetical protein
MCIFTQAVQSVSKTRIFARTLPDGTEPHVITDAQVLVYQMLYGAVQDLAMILPIPTVVQSNEDAIKWVDLSGQPDFFQKLSDAFPKAQTLGLSNGTRGVTKGFTPLAVHDVGDFEASFVPTIADFSRLDARFRLSPDVWQGIPQYADWGFAVFKLKGSTAAQTSGMQIPRPNIPARNSGVKEPHPMAFIFPRRADHGLFFPTVHVHDGVVHPTGDFDHMLYLQSDPKIEEIMSKDTNWQSSGTKIPGDIQLVDADEPAYRMRLQGELTNVDVVIG